MSWLHEKGTQQKQNVCFPLILFPKKRIIH